MENECIKAENDMLGLAVKIAERIIRTSVKLDSSIILDVMRKYAVLCTDKENIRIHVSLSDYTQLSSIPEEQ